MIRFAQENESEQIVSLWQEAFGDSREWVMLYLSENIKNVLVYEEDGIVMGMLSLLEVSYKGKKGYYVYGVATGSEYRSKGISTKLLEYAKNLVKEDGFLVLVPRNQGLFDFYSGRGFVPVYSVETVEYNRDELTEKSDDVIVYSANCREYYEIRKQNFVNLIEWDEDKLRSIRKFENGRYYKTETGEGAFCYCYNGKLYIKELCGKVAVAGAVTKEYETVRSLSIVGVGYLRGFVPSTRGPG